MPHLKLRKIQLGKFCCLFPRHRQQTCSASVDPIPGDTRLSVADFGLANLATVPAEEKHLYHIIIDVDTLFTHQEDEDESEFVNLETIYNLNFQAINFAGKLSKKILDLDLKANIHIHILTPETTSISDKSPRDSYGLTSNETFQKVFSLKENPYENMDWFFKKAKQFPCSAYTDDGVTLDHDLLSEITGSFDHSNAFVFSMSHELTESANSLGCHTFLAANEPVLSQIDLQEWRRFANNILDQGESVAIFSDVDESALDRLLTLIALKDGGETQLNSAVKDLLNECQTQFPLATKKLLTTRSDPDGAYQADLQKLANKFNQLKVLQELLDQIKWLFLPEQARQPYLLPLVTSINEELIKLKISMTDCREKLIKLHQTICESDKLPIPKEYTFQIDDESKPDGVLNNIVTKLSKLKTLLDDCDRRVENFNMVSIHMYHACYGGVLSVKSVHEKLQTFGINLEFSDTSYVGRRPKIYAIGDFIDDRSEDLPKITAVLLIDDNPNETNAVKSAAKKFLKQGVRVFAIRVLRRGEALESSYAAIEELTLESIQPTLFQALHMSASGL